MAERLERKRASNELDYALLAANAELPKAPRRALDFGCGIGGWLDVLAADGWETAGIEPGRAPRPRRGRHTLLEEIPAEPSLQLVVVQHTLEHLDDPLETLRRLAGATVPGGLVYVSVPNCHGSPSTATSTTSQATSTSLPSRTTRSERYSLWRGSSSSPTRTTPRGGSRSSGPSA